MSGSSGWTCDWTHLPGDRKPPFLDPRKPNMDTTKNESLEFGIFEKSMDSFSGGVGIKLAKVSMNRSWRQVSQHVTNKTLVFLQ